jgi:hypothetical protein
MRRELLSGIGGTVDKYSGAEATRANQVALGILASERDGLLAWEVCLVISLF